MTMNDRSAFNPYLKWLGIRSSSPDHYQLLGIERFEPEDDVIAAAADRQMAHVRKYQNGPQSAWSQQLLNELAAAKICLLSPERRRAYDAELQATTQPPDTPKTGKFVALAGLATALTIAFALWWFGAAPFSSDRNQNPDSTRLVQAQQDQPQKQQTGDEPLVSVIEAPESTQESASSDLKQAPWNNRPQRRPPKKPFPGKQHAKAKLLQAIYFRNQKAANAQIDKVLSGAKDNEQRLESIQLEAVYLKSKEFWEKVNVGLERSEAGQSVEFRGVSVSVESKVGQSLTLKAPNGESRSFSLKKNEMDPDLAIALARANGQATGTILDVMIAVFLATDSKGDLISAKPLLQKALAAGVPVEMLLSSNKSSDDSAAATPPTETPGIVATPASPTDNADGNSSESSVSSAAAPDSLCSHKH